MRLLLLTIFAVSLALPAKEALSQGSFADFQKQMQQNLNRFSGGMLGPISSEEMQEIQKIPVSVREEQQFGQQILKRFSGNLRDDKGRRTSIAYRGGDVDYLKELAACIHPLMVNQKRYKQFKIGIMQTNQVDAFSIPGGTILFSRGLLETAKSEAAVVGVLAHELSHLDRQHQLLGLRRQKQAQQKPNFANMMSNLSEVMKPFHAEFESQADEDAVSWMLQLDYEPKALAELLLRWNATQDAEQPWKDIMPGFLLTHPDGGSRADDVMKWREEKRQPDQTLHEGIENLAERKPRVSASP
ncbi:MAG: M48 family metallopeptidase [Planctomycetota bacterium]